MFKKILVCLDGSKIAEETLPFVIDEARYRGSQVVLMRVSELSRFLPVWASGPPQQVLFMPPTLLKDDLTKQTALERAYLERVSARLRNEGIEATSVLLTALPSDVAETIVGYAADNDIDLIAMATRGGGWWERLFWGSITAAVVKRSPAPVLVVRGDTAAGFGLNRDCPRDYLEAAGQVAGSRWSQAGGG